MTPLPRGAARIAMWLFLAALGMLFAAAILAYILIRVTGSQRPPLGTIALPCPLWLSTAALVGVSIALERACRCVARERQRRFRVWLGAALIAAAGFIALQAPSLAALLNTHIAHRAAGATTLYGLVFTLIGLHACHVAGGLVPLVVTVARARRGRYDHEHYEPVRRLALYWHFLDIVWIVMLAVMWLMG